MTEAHPTADSNTSSRLPAETHGAVVSWNQRTLLVLHLARPESPAYNMSLALRFPPDYNIHRMVEVFRAGVRAHPPLRTGYRLKGQTVETQEYNEDAAEIIIEEAATPEACKARLTFWADAPFDLTTGRVARLAIVCDARGDRYTGLTLHHIAGDHYAFEQLMQDLTAAWQGEEAFPVISTDYARWVADQNAYLASPKGGEALAAWQDILEPARPKLSLPTDGTIIHGQSFEGGHFNEVWDPAFCHLLRDFSMRHRVTRYITLMAGFQLFLSALSGQKRFLLGTPSAGRFTRADRNVIGYCANPILVPADLSEVSTFADHVARTNTVVRQVFALQKLPMAYVLDQTLGGRDPGEMSLAPYFFTFVQQRARTYAAEVGYDVLWSQQRGAAHALNLLVQATGDELQAHWRFDKAFYMPETVQAFAEDFRRFMVALCAAPENDLDAIAWQCWAGKDAALIPAQEGTALSQIEEVPAARPALFAGSETKTFGGLRGDAQRLGATLQSHGVIRGEPVGLLVRDEAVRIPAMLSAWLAGAAFVPLDPEAPPARLKVQLSAAKIRVVVGDVGAARPNWFSDETVWVTADDTVDGAALSPVALSPKDTAYLIFTSGSTGAPKPVAMSHRALVRYVRGLNERLAPSDRVVFASLAGPAADLGYTSLFGGLISGHAVRLLPAACKLDAGALAAHLRDYPVDVLKITPSHFSALCMAGDDVYPKAALILGGEVPARRLVERVRDARPNLAIFNHYGPTEACIGAAAGLIKIDRPGDLVVDGVIGEALGGNRLYILDDDFNPLPRGAIGDLYLAGEQLADGYAHAPWETAARFLPNPFSSIPGARLYDTGDRARRLADDSIQFCGRRDRQVKVRGHRVELAEIEREIASFEGVGETAVAVIGDETKQLVALYTGMENAKTLAACLAERVPGAMLPHHWHRLEQFPLLPNGKRDQAKLNQIAADCIHPLKDGVGKSTPTGRQTQETLRAIWRDVLKCGPVADDDNFFALGGDSILSLHVAAAAKKAGFDLSPKDIFTHQTLSALSHHLAARSAPDIVVEDTGFARQASYPLTPIQNWFFARQPDAPDHWNQSVLLQLPARLDPMVVKRAALALVARYPILSVRFEQATGARRVVPGPLPAEDDLLVWETCARFAQVQSACRKLERSLSPATGQHCRFGLFEDQATGKAYLFATAHHLVIDAVSWRILLSAFFEAGSGDILGDVRDWAGLALAQTETNDEERAAAKHYNRELVSGLGRGGLNLPPPDFGRFGDAEHLSFELPEDAATALLKEAVTALRLDPQILMVTALMEAWSKVMGPSGCLVELEGHGRTAANSAAVGWFTERYPVFLDVGSLSSHAARLEAVAEAILSVPDAAKRAYAGLWTDAPNPDTPAPVVAPLLFNYLGEGDLDANAPAGFCRVDWPLSEMRDPAARRPNGLEVTVDRKEGALRVRLDFSPAFISRAEVQALAGAFGQALTQISQVKARGPLRAEMIADLSSAFFEVINETAKSDLQDVWPVTPVQQGMVIQSALSCRPEVYVNVTAFDIEGLDDPHRLISAWEHMIARHDILRGVFHLSGEVPHFVVHKTGTLDLREEDWRDKSNAEQDIAFKARLTQEGNTAFDIEAGPLMRLVLICTGAQRYRLIWSRHHLIVDGWTSALIAFEALSLAKGGVLPPAPSCRGYFEWVAGQDRAAMLAWWQKVTDGSRFEGRLSQDVPENAPEEAPPPMTWCASEHLQTRLEAGARTAGVTTASMVHLCWALTLAKYMGTATPLFGTVSAGRPAEVAGIDRMAGIFINTLPAAFALNPSEPVGAALQATQAHLAEMRENGLVSLADLQANFGGETGRPLFDTLLIVENYPMASAAFDDGEMSIRLSHAEEESDYPLTVQILPGERLEVIARCGKGGGIDASTLSALMEVFAGAMDFIAGDGALDKQLGGFFAPRSKSLNSDIGEGRVATDEELWFSSKTFHARVAGARNANAPAVAWKAGEEGSPASRTLGDIYDEARAIARALVARRLGREAIIGLSLERDTWLISTILGAHMAGVCYTPADPDRSAAHRERIYRLAGCKLCIGTDGVAPRVLAEEGRALLADTPDWTPPVVHKDQLAYVLFTSGSTGEPKGVGVPFSALTALLESVGQRLDGAGAGRWLALTPVTFDIAYLELFAPLYLGGSLAIAPPETARDGVGILSLVQAEDAQVIQATPSSWSLAVAALDEVDDAVTQHWARATLISGGEALSSALAERLTDCAKTVWNFYGPTEATVWSAAALLEPGGPVSLGEALEGEALYILDDFLRPVEAGRDGDLWISGAGLARGYLRAPGLTGAAFLPDPFAAPGVRMYATGDRAKRLSDGTLCFVGRRDDQVKLRGHRVELGEVEAILAEAPGVAAGAVRLWEAGTPRARLVAYAVASESGAKLDAATWRSAIARYMGERLGQSLQPTQIIHLDALPLTANGKINRVALPKPNGARAGGPPKGETEIWLAAAWAMLLELTNTDEIGRDTPFFALGGNSLTAARLVAHIRSEKGVDVPLAEIFAEPSLQAMAAVLDRIPAPQADADLAIMADLLDELL